MFEKIRKPGSSRMGMGKKIVATVLFGLICLVFVFLDIGPGQFGNFAAGGAAAVVNSKVISIYDFRERVRRLEEQFGNNFGNLPAAQRQIFTRNIRERALEELINFEVLSQSASSIGIMATNQAIVDSIVNIPAFQQDGRFRREQYDLYLRSTRMTASDFEKRVADEVVFNRIRDIFSKSLEDTTLLKASQDELKGTKANLEYLQFSEDQLKKNLKPSKDQLAQFQSENADKIKNYYDSNLDEFTNKAETKARHILIKADPNKEGDDQRALKRIQEIQEEAKTADFGELAKKYSEDPGSKAKNGDLGFFSKGRMVKEFEEVAFSLPVGNTSGPVKTSYGYHLIKVEERRGGDIKQLPTVTEEIAQTLISGDLYKAEIEKLRASLKDRDSKAVADFARRVKLKWEETGEFEISRSFVPKLGDNDALVIGALGQKPGQLVPKLEQKGSTNYIVRLKSLKTEKATQQSDDLPEDFSVAANEAFGNWATEVKKDFQIDRNSSLLGPAPQAP